MKKLVLAALVLVSSTAFAQGPAPAEAPTPKDMAMTIGRTMGTLPVMQEACGHSAKQKAEFKAGLAGMAKQLEAKQGGTFKTDYEAGVRQGEALMKNQMGNFEPAKLAELCTQFNEKYPEMMAKLKSVALAPEAKK